MNDMDKLIIPALFAIIASALIGIHSLPVVKAACPYSAAALSTGKIACTTNGYTLSGSGGSTVTCNSGTRTVTANGHTITQPGAC
jgi:hypothetical protein